MMTLNRLIVDEYEKSSAQTAFDLAQYYFNLNGISQVTNHQLARQYFQTYLERRSEELVKKRAAAAAQSNSNTRNQGGNPQAALQAEEDLEQKRNMDAHLCLGLFFYKEKNMPEALNHIEEAYKHTLFESRPDYLYRFAIYAFKEGKYPKVYCLLKRYNEIISARLSGGLTSQEKEALERMLCYTENIRLSSLYQMDPRRFIQSFCQKTRENFKFSKTVIKLFILSVKNANPPISNPDVYSSLARIYALDETIVDENVKKDIASILSKYWAKEKDYRLAFAWAALNKDEGIVECKNEIHKHGWKNKAASPSSVKEQLFVSMCSTILLLAFVYGRYWCHNLFDFKNIFYIIPFLLFAGFLTSYIRYFYRIEQRKVFLFLWTAAIVLLFIILNKVLSDISTVGGRLIVYCIAFLFEYAIVFAIRNNIKSYLRETFIYCMNFFSHSNTRGNRI